MRPSPDPAAVTGALAGLFAEVAADLADDELGPVEVYDGQAPDSGYAPRWLAVGMPWEDDQQPVALERAELGAGRRVRLDYAVACVAYAGAGDPDEGQYRAQVSALVVAVDQQLQADPTVGGLVARAQIADLDLSLGADSQGYGALGAFTVVATVI